jgi:hypothetical protein
MKAASIALAAALAACASTSGVLQIGKDTFTLRKEQGHGFSGSGPLKAEAYREATSHCKAMGREMMVTRTSENRPPFVLGNYPFVELDFLCLDANDPEYQRNRMRKDADTVIELRK